MIIGKIRPDQEAVIELEVVGLNHSEKVEVVIDTGFTGFLMLPYMEIYQDFFKGICLENSTQLFLDSQS